MLRKGTRYQERKPGATGAPGKKKTRNKELVRRAMQITGSTEPGMISLCIEDILREEMTKWKNTNCTRGVSYIFSRMETLGLGSLYEIREIIAQVQEEDWWNETSAMGV